MSECQSNERDTEVSRSHSTREVFVMKTEGRAESLKRESFFLEVVKAKTSLRNKQDREELNSRMNPPGAGERGTRNHLFAEGVPVWYVRSGKVILNVCLMS